MRALSDSRLFSPSYRGRVCLSGNVPSIRSAYFPVSSRSCRSCLCMECLVAFPPFPPFPPHGHCYDHEMSVQCAYLSESRAIFADHSIVLCVLPKAITAFPFRLQRSLPSWGLASLVTFLRSPGDFAARLCGATRPPLKLHPGSNSTARSL